MRMSQGAKMNEQMKRLEKNRLLYKKVVKKMQFEEKLWLLECDGDYDIYEKRLLFLAKKYATSV